MTDGGNLTLEFTIQAADVRGPPRSSLPTLPLAPIRSRRSLDSSRKFYGFGGQLYKRQQYGLKLASVFVESLGKRWERDGPGFHTSPCGGHAQELTTTPLGLGTLGAKSARNIKLAEDILTPLGSRRPIRPTEAI